MKKSRPVFVHLREWRRKQQKIQLARTISALLCVLLIGTIAITSRYDSKFEQWVSWHPSLYGSWVEQWIGPGQSQQLLQVRPRSAVLPLVSSSSAQRAVRLQAIAQLPKSQDRARARYLLASDLIQQKQGQKALKWLQGLDQEYPTMVAYIALKRAQAYELIGNKAEAKLAWQELLKRSTLWYKRHPDNPVAAEALLVLGRTDPKYWDEAIAQFPSHPRTLRIVRERLKQNPNQPQLLLILAKYAYDQPKIIPILDLLVSQPETKLEPEDWESIGFAYWENREYDKAAAAYANAPRNPGNAYRIGRGRQLSNQPIQAAAAYIRLTNKYPYAKETGTALLQLASMKIAQAPEEALSYVDLIVSRFPDLAGAALMKRAIIVNNLDNPNSAAEARNLLLTKYGDSEAAAQYRWKMALAKAAAKDYRGAWQWAAPIPTRNPKSILAPRAGFWVGKWAKRLGRQRDAKAAFEYVLSQFPQSYYAWRSAAILGLDVGNFTNIRKIKPQVEPPRRAVLPTGSATLKELYLLGQDRDAWTLWQAEFTNRMQPTVAEQFTDGLMRLLKGDNLVGIAKVSTLEDRKTPQEQAEYQALRQQLAYWQALYPFPFLKEITTWSPKRQLNPLLVTALIRQESRFQPKIRSVAGAVGLMQMTPGTGKWVAEQIDLKKYNLENPNNNVRMGTWFLDYTHRQYQNNSLLAVASYNAGSGNLSKWLKKQEKDPDEFVEAIPFDETRDYVKQVFGNYWNYLRLYNPKISRLVAKYSDDQPQRL